MFNKIVNTVINKLTCRHNWNILKTVEVYSEFGHDATVYVCSCSKCGKIKKVKV